MSLVLSLLNNQLNLFLMYSFYSLLFLILYHKQYDYIYLMTIIYKENIVIYK
jgi:hypothetical protein